MEKKVDFRNAYKSDHLGSIDLEGMIEDGVELVFTINKVVHSETKVAGKKGIFNVAYFKEGIKPLVLNSGNAKIVRKLSGSKSVNPADWGEIKVELTIDYNVRFGSETVSGIRVKEFSTLTSKPQLKKMTAEQLTKAVDAVNAEQTTLEAIKKHYELTVDQENMFL